jgi:hypothetical protein
MSLLGAKRTWPVAVHMSAYDPKRTSCHGAKASTCLGLSIVVNRRRRATCSGAVSGQQGRRTIKSKVRKAPTAPASTDHSAEQFDRLKRERDEVRQQQAATAEILRVIRASPTDVQPVFETIVRSAVSLCGSLYANAFRFDGELLHFIASRNMRPSDLSVIRKKYPMRPDSSQVSGRVVRTKSVFCSR